MIDLDAIRARMDEFFADGAITGHGDGLWATPYRDDIDALLAEVEQLQALIAGDRSNA